MANIKSQKKRALTNLKRQNARAGQKSELKTAIKKANAAVDGNAAEKSEAIKVAIKKIDQAAAKGLIHKNNAARKKSALVKKLNAAG